MGFYDNPMFFKMKDYANGESDEKQQEQWRAVL